MYLSFFSSFLLCAAAAISLCSPGQRGSNEGKGAQRLGRVDEGDSSSSRLLHLTAAQQRSFGCVKGRAGVAGSKVAAGEGEGEEGGGCSTMGGGRGMGDAAKGEKGSKGGGSKRGSGKDNGRLGGGGAAAGAPPAAATSAVAAAAGGLLEAAPSATAAEAGTLLGAAAASADAAAAGGPPLPLPVVAASTWVSPNTTRCASSENSVSPFPSPWSSR